MTEITREEIERMSKTIRLYSNPLWEADLARLLAVAERSLTEQSRIDEAVGRERERCAGIADNYSRGRSCGCNPWLPAEIRGQVQRVYTPTPTTEEGR